VTIRRPFLSTERKYVRSAFAAPDVLFLRVGLAAGVAALLVLARLTLLLLLLAGRSALLVVLLLLRVPVVVSHRASPFHRAL
jgi:hypothetical protein